MPTLCMVAHRAPIIIAFALLLLVAGLALSRLGDSPLVRAELSAQDFMARHGRLTPPNPKLIFLAIDNDSVGLDDQTDLKNLFGIEDATTPEGTALTRMSRGYPWPRSVYALVLDRLVAAGARVVAFDLLFPKPSDDDALLQAALERHAGCVVVGSNFTATGSDQGRVNAALMLPASTLIPQGDTTDPRVGFVNFWPDEADGVIRSARAKTSFAHFLGAAESPDDPLYTSLSARAAVKSQLSAVSSLDSIDRRFRFTNGPQQGFPPHSIFEIFVPEYWARNFQSGAVFKDAVVIVGASGNWQHDEHPTPFGVMSGPEIQLNVLNALLHREFLRPFPGWASLATWILAAVWAAFCGLRWSSAPVRILALVVAAAAWLGVQFILFNRFGLSGPIAGPLVIIVLIGLFSLLYDLVCAAAEQIRLRLALHERKRAQDILEQTNEELERRVAERTARLSEANVRLEGLLQEKDVLLKEIHHRVKNNLQVISSLLNLQSGSIEDPATREMFKESRNRVRSMALIHEKLYQSHDLSRIDFQDYLKSLTNSLSSSFGGRSGTTKIQLDVDTIMLGVDAAVPCGLIVNELVTNCYKHAFKGRERGEITVALKRIGEEQYRLSVSDDGVGLPEDLDIQNTESLGMQIVTTLSEQLNGSVAVRNGSGSTFEISFTEPELKKP